MRRLITLLACGLASCTSLDAAHTEARLVLSHTTARAGETVMAGIHLRMEPRWHTYWRNGGDAGAPTKIDWTLPAGMAAGEIRWPVPEKIDTAGLTSYAYNREVVLLIPLTLDGAVAAGLKDIQANVSWLECAELCLPGKANVSVSLNIGPATSRSPDADWLDAWQKKLPRIPASFDARASWEAGTNAESRTLVLEWPKPAGAKTGDFFPFASAPFAVKGETETLSGDANRFRIRKTVEKFEGDWPGQIAGLVVSHGDGDSILSADEVTLVIAAAPAAAGTAPANAASAASAPSKSLVGFLLFAFLGGLILNIMPCVLPVIALKILGFVNQAREAPAQVRKLGVVYTLGVLASFLALAGIVIGVMKAGSKASWGMQFGNPVFLVCLTVLVTLVALNLFGVFEVTLGSATMDAAGTLAAKEGSAGAFFNGVLATALATPCTAPFLGAALGFAFTQPPGTIVMFFLAAGLGLALPYLLLSWHPAWMKFLPKPGAWMEKFKIAMGFPMLATAVWLFTLAAEHYSNVIWLGFFLVFVALAAWIFGAFVQHGRSRPGLALGIAAAVLVFGYAYALETELNWRHPAPPQISANANDMIKESPDGIEWRRWTSAAVAQARAEGRPILVDFTAKWCVTCQANKKLAIEVPSVRAKLKAIDAVALLGDYTKTPADITEELGRFGRAGVPLVLVYPRDTSQPPIVLPEVLPTPTIVLDALEKAAGPGATSAKR